MADDICGLSFPGWEMGAAGLSLLWAYWYWQMSVIYNSLERHCLLSHHAPGPVSNVRRKMTIYVHATIYPVPGPKLSTVYAPLQGIQMGK